MTGDGVVGSENSLSNGIANAMRAPVSQLLTAAQSATLQNRWSVLPFPWWRVRPPKPKISSGFVVGSAGAANKDKVEQAKRDTAEAGRKVTWWAFVGTILSMAAAAGGGYLGAGPTFRLFATPVRTNPNRTNYN